MDKQPKETVAICIPKDIMDYINEGISSRKFADVSHAVELMAFDHMKNLDPKDESTLEKIERLAMGTVERSVAAVKETSDKVKEMPIGKTMMESADKVQDRTKQAFEFSKNLMKDGVEKVKGTIAPGEEKKCGCGEEDCNCVEKGKKIDIE
jgi:hypothetical protein